MIQSMPHDPKGGTMGDAQRVAVHVVDLGYVSPPGAAEAGELRPVSTTHLTAKNITPDDLTDALAGIILDYIQRSHREDEPLSLADFALYAVCRASDEYADLPPDIQAVI